MTHFLDALPTTENRWRALILLGRNTASYKFALGKALLDLKAAPGDLLRLDELALPFALSLSEHLKVAPKQGATNINKALREGCESFNRGELERDALREIAVRHGFGDVIRSVRPGLISSGCLVPLDEARRGNQRSGWQNFH